MLSFPFDQGMVLTTVFGHSEPQDTCVLCQAMDHEAMSMLVVERDLAVLTAVQASLEVDAAEAAVASLQVEAAEAEAAEAAVRASLEVEAAERSRVRAERAAMPLRQAGDAGHWSEAASSEVMSSMFAAAGVEDDY